VTFVEVVVLSDVAVAVAWVYCIVWVAVLVVVAAVVADAGKLTNWVQTMAKAASNRAVAAIEANFLVTFYLSPKTKP
jgi:hypothetical protein